MSTVVIEQEGPLAVVRINRPEVHNALNTEVLQELLEQLAQLEAKVVVLTGAGERAFVSGADIKEMCAMDEEEWRAFTKLGHTVMDTLENAPFVSIAAVNGHCFGGGLELALACDFIFVKEDAELGMPEAKLGAIPSFGGVKRLKDAIGTRLAKEVMMTGRRLSAEEAWELKLINRVCSGKGLLPESLSFAHTLTENDFGAVLALKRGESYYFHLEERRKRMGAFLQK